MNNNNPIMNINEMSMSEIIEKVGILGSPSEFTHVFIPNMKFNDACHHAIGDIFQSYTIYMGNKSPETLEKLKETLQKHEALIDKEYYVLACLMAAREGKYKISGDIIEYGMSKTEFPNGTVINNKKDYMSNLLAYSNSDVVHRDNIKIDNETGTARIVSFQDEIRGTKYTNRKNNARYEEIRREYKKAERTMAEIEKEMPLEKFLAILIPADLYYFCRYPELAEELSQMIESVDFNDMESNQKYFAQVVRNNAKYMDIDKMLLLATKVYFVDWAKKEKDYDAMYYAAEVADIAGKYISNPKTSIVFGNEYKRENGEFQFESITAELEDFMRCFVKGEYCTPEQKAELRRSILAGTLPFAAIDPIDYFVSMTFNNKELAQICSHYPEALQYFIENEIIPESDIDEILDLQRSFSLKAIKLLTSSEIMNNQKLFNLYMQGKINLDDIRALVQENGERFVDIVSADEFREAYVERDSEEGREYWEKYSKLYKAIKIEGKTDEEKAKVSDEIIDEDTELKLINEETFYDLYRLGFITCDKVVDFIGTDALSEFLSSGEMKPLDVRRLFDNGIITEKMFEDVLKNAAISDEQKLVIIFSTFPEPEDLEMRTKLLGYLPPVEGGIHHPPKGRRGPGEGPKKVNKNVTDPCTRWRLIAAIDPDYTQKVFKDGHVVFYLPNEGEYVVEKLFDKDMQFAYGAATYFVEEEIYEEQKDRIEQKGKIDRPVLTELLNEGKAKSEPHIDWEKRICRHFDIENESKYTLEKRKQIEELAIQVEKSKRQMSL